MTTISCLNRIVPNLNKDYDITDKSNSDGCFSGYDCGGGAIVDGGKQILQINEDDGFLIGCSGDNNINQYLNKTTTPIKTDRGYKWYYFNDTFVAFETPESVREPQLTKKLFDCIEIDLAGDSEVISFNFSNDWINGSLFAPKYLTKTKKSRNGLAPKIQYCGSKSYSNLYLTKSCATSINNDGEQVSGQNELCLDNKCVEQSTSKQIQGSGLIQRNNELFYYKAKEFQPSSDTILFSTDIVLIGGLKTCDKDGIPNLHYLIPPTTFKIPQDEVEYVEGSDTSVELTGIDWGNLEIPGNLQSNGLYTSIGCLSADTIIKSCVNAERQCELGVDFDQRQELTGSVVITPNGYIDFNDISDSDTKAMFATLNINELETKTENGLIKYNLNYNYPESFDGKLRAVSVSTDLPSSEYIKFRFGNTQPVYYVNYRFPKYNNSFYFYFGLKLGSTAIEQFNSQFFAPCDSVEDKLYTPIYSYTSQFIEFDYEMADYEFVGFVDYVQEQVEILPPITTIINANDSYIDKILFTGNTVYDGEATVIERGVVWNTTGNPNVDDDDKRSIVGGVGNFTVTADTLTEGETYYLKVYSINEFNGVQQIGYSNEIIVSTYQRIYTYSSEFIDFDYEMADYEFVDFVDYTQEEQEIDPPTTIMLAVDESKHDRITVTGNTLYVGDAIVIERGVTWNETGDPNIVDDSKELTTGGVGNFVVTADTLDEGTLYYMKTYSINEFNGVQQVGYSDEFEATTYQRVHSYVSVFENFDYEMVDYEFVEFVDYTQEEIEV